MSSWFFSYGTSADPDHLAKEIGEVAESKPGTILDHRLTFANEREAFGGGTSCIVPAPGQHVIGVLHRVTDAQMAILATLDATYGLVDKSAETDAGPVAVQVLLPRTIGAFAAPADVYVGHIRAALSAFYRIGQVDAHLKQALERDAIFTSIVAQWAAEAKPNHEYNTLFRRLLPWDGLVRTPWGGAWATIDPGEASELFPHDEEEIAIVVSGEGEMRVDADIRLIRKGDVVYFQPDCEHVVTNTAQTPLEVLFFWWGGRDGTLWAGRKI